MAEVQESTRAGENAARFIEFVMMQAQNASLFLGLIPNPGTGEPEVNLELARMFIDQLAMIGEKTRGNLSTEETQVLRNALSNLQMAFYEVSQGRGPSAGDGRDSSAPEPLDEPELSSAPAPEASAPRSESIPPPATPPPDSGESKKRFTKSYGS